jgi:hypothetical protein
MAAAARPRLSKEMCLAMANECRALALAATQRPHRIMLEHIASTWDRIAETYQDDHE